MSATAAADYDVLTCGEAMCLLIAQQVGPLEQAERFDRATAGAELNVAIGLARLGLRVGYVSRLGCDALGGNLLAALDREGIDRQHVRLSERHPTGLMFKSRTADGTDPRVEYFRRGSAASHMDGSDCPAGLLARTRHLHLTGILPALSAGTSALADHLAREAKSAGCTISFDPNLRPSLWPSTAVMVERLNGLAARCDWILPGLAEGRILTGQQQPEAIAQFYLDRGAQAVVVKLGAAGAYYASGGTRGIVPGAAVARVVDTVGAGDGFAVGLISARLEGHDLPQAVARGNAIGARVVGFPGDCDGLPRRAELAAMMTAYNAPLPHAG
jgi:sugar/nucleoside kinase (ribokinase family)